MRPARYRKTATLSIISGCRQRSQEARAAVNAVDNAIYPGKVSSRKKKESKLPPAMLRGGPGQAPHQEEPS